MNRNQGNISFTLSNKNRRILFNKIFLYGLFVLALLALLTFAGCNSTPTTSPVNEEKLAIDLNTPNIEMAITGYTPHITFLELANYNGKLIGVKPLDIPKIKNYNDIAENTEKIGMNWFLGFYTKEQVRQSIINGFPGITIQAFCIGCESYVYKIIDAFDDYGKLFKANDPYNGDDFIIPFADWEAYSGSPYATFFIMYKDGEKPFKDFLIMPIEIENWPELPPGGYKDVPIKI